MVRIVKTEFYKLKRYHILWAGVALMLLSVLLTLFTSMANDGSADYRSYLSEGRQLFSRCNHCFCLWIWRDVCRRKYDISKPLSDYRKSRNGRLP